MGNVCKSVWWSSVSHATVFWWHSQFAAIEELIEDTDQSGKLGTTKMNENITRVAAVLKDNRHATCSMIAESTVYGKLLFTAFCLMIWKNEYCEHNLCHRCWQQNNGNSVLFMQKTELSLYSPDLSPPDYFAFLK